MRKVEGGAVVGPIAEAANMDTPSDSVLGVFLLHAIFWGMMSVTISQKIAALAIADGARGKSLERPAQCGGGGARAADTWRDLRKRLKTLFVQTGCVITKVPLAMKAVAEEFDVTMLMPHKLLSVMYHRHGAEFLQRLCGGDAGSIATFWDNMHGHPSYPTHPMHNHEYSNHRTHGIPIRLHGDGVTSIACGKIWSKSVEALSWSSCLAKPGASWVTNCLILFVFECIVAGESMDVVFANLAWSLYWAYLGAHPDRCPKGILYTTRG